MPAVNTVFALTRAIIAARIIGATDGATSPTTALTVGASRAKLGWYAGQTTKTFYKDLVDNGPLALVGLMAFDVAHTDVGPMYCTSSLFFAKDKSADWDGQDVMNLLVNMKDRLLDASQYTGGAIAPQQFSVDGWAYDFENSPGILACQLRLEFIDPSVKTDKPGLLSQWTDDTSVAIVEALEEVKGGKAQSIEELIAAGRCVKTETPPDSGYPKTPPKGAGSSALPWLHSR